MYVYICINIIFFLRERERDLAVSRFISTIHKICFNVKGFHSWIFFWIGEKQVHRMAACMAYVFFVPLRIHPFFSGFLGTVRIPTDVHGQDLLLALVPLHHLRLGRKKGVQGLWGVNQSKDYFRWFGP